MFLISFRSIEKLKSQVYGLLYAKNYSLMQYIISILMLLCNCNLIILIHSFLSEIWNILCIIIYMLYQLIYDNEQNNFRVHLIWYFFFLSLIYQNTISVHLYYHYYLFLKWLTIFWHVKKWDEKVRYKVGRIILL